MDVNMFQKSFMAFLLTALTFCWVHIAKAKVNFVKDQSMDVVFPGPVFKADPSLPEGHMRPLGWQRRTDGPVKVEEGMLSTKEFYNDYVEKNIPVVFRNGIIEAPVFENWKNDLYILKTYGELNVTVRIKTGRKRNKILSVEQSLKMKKFLQEYLHEEWYVATEIPDAMMAEFPLPGCVRCGNINEMMWSSALWMSSGGTSSRIHSHDDHLLHCVIFGRRDFIVIDTFHKKSLEFEMDYPGSLGGHSDLNTERIDVYDTKQVSRVPWTWATLLGGDCIYIPSGYIHQVRSYGRTVSFTIEFASVNSFDDTGCTLLDDEFVPLSDAEFFWKFEDGKKRLSNESLTVDGLRKLLIAMLGTRDSLTFDSFNHFYKKVAPDSSKAPPARQVFDFMLSEEEESVITRVGIYEIPESALKRIIDVFISFSRWDGRKEEVKEEQLKRPIVHEEF